MPARILITGARAWDDLAGIAGAFTQAHLALGEPAEVTVVSGACPNGADALCEAEARRREWTVERHPARWDEHGKAAGFVRNAHMVSLGADLVLAFVAGQARGTRHTIGQAIKAMLHVVVTTPQGAFSVPPCSPQDKCALCALISRLPRWQM